MTAHTSCTVLWFFGISPENVRLIRETAGEGYECRVLDGLAPAELKTAMEQCEVEDPLILWLGGQAWRDIAMLPDAAQRFQLVPTVLVLEPEPCRETLELALDAPMQQVVRAPFSSSQVFDALSRALEARNLYRDMDRMAREILMGRELLERKSDVCSFLFSFFAAAEKATDARSLLTSCRQCLAESFPLAGVHAVWWGEKDSASYLVAADRDSQAREWLQFLRSQTRRLCSLHERIDEKRREKLVDGLLFCIGGTPSSPPASPEVGQVVMLPLEVSGRICGALALHFDAAFLSGRDMALAFDAMRRHLSLVLWEGSRREEFFAARPVVKTPHRRSITHAM